MFSGTINTQGNSGLRLKRMKIDFNPIFGDKGYFFLSSTFMSYH